ncbi:XrtA system polysaccharide deacetylase [Candidatus Omnitrophota bacterium]
MKNAFTVDLEDWFCAIGDIFNKPWEECESRIERSTFLLLKILSKHKVKATFFVLGWIAERFPELIKEIDRASHEIASHGYGHGYVSKMTPEEFEEDLKKSLKAISRSTVQQIIGFRAPGFNVSKDTSWLFEILARNGIKYDSSIFPLRLLPNYNSNIASLRPHKVNSSIWEFPLSCVDLYGMRLPCSGGVFFRVFPYIYTKLSIKRINKRSNPVIFYIHPWDLDPKHPRVNLPKLRQLRHYCNLDKIERRLEYLLNDFEFATVKEVLNL